MCYVDLMERSTPERADATDEVQGRAYAEDLEERIQRIVDARAATRVTGLGGGGGVVIPPLSSAHEWERTPRRTMDLPDFGQGGVGDVHREGAGDSEQVPREWPTGEQGHLGEGKPATICACQAGR